MKICPNCGNEVKEDSNYCDKCGKSLVENDVIEPEVVDRTYESDMFVKEQTLLRDEYSKRASNAFLFSILSLLLCCCAVLTIIPITLSITLLMDMKKMSVDIKNTEEYRKIKNQAIIALAISGLVLAYSIVSYIFQMVNPTPTSSSSSIMMGE